MVAGPTSEPPITPDGRYIMVRGRLWRRSNPTLGADELAELKSALGRARAAVRPARPQGGERLTQARAAVDEAKVALGERGPVWWADGAPDMNRRLAKNTPYAEWTRGVDGDPEG